MAGKFGFKKFADIDISDSFFDSLKTDYPGTANSSGFEKWFKEKSNRTALVYEDDAGIAGFVALKQEHEEVLLKEGRLPKERRIKVSTIKISERHQGERFGEGAIGLMLWYWQKEGVDEIYVTVFDKHEWLIFELEKFGFHKVGQNLNGEGVYVKRRTEWMDANPYKSFPFIRSGFDYAGYLILDARYHDNMFAYSELAKSESLQEWIGNSVINGLSKIYVGKAPEPNHKVGEPILIYRKDAKEGPGKRYRSCVTSYAVVTDVIQAKYRGNVLVTFEDLLKRIGNKSIFDKDELKKQYDEYYNVSIVGMLYYGYFGAGNNINLDWLERNGCWKSNPEQYPTTIHLTEEQFKRILKEGNVNVSNVVIH